MKVVEPVINPTRKQNFTLRLMIIIGLFCMFLFLRELLLTDAESSTLYWMLMATLVFMCMKILHEWIHYFYITVPDTPKKEKTYTVDIFTTFCAGEPYEMINETLIAIKAIKYPHNTFLCDEADDPYLKKICEELNVIHVTRVKKIDAKAGNINNALKQSTAELCVVLDPDHVPFPDFLDPIVSHFNNLEVGFVQIVQSYKNYDESLIAKGAAQQTFQFYGPIMMTMNKYGTVLAIGANCTFRRAALDSIGGHAAGLAEDMHTAMQLHAKGWKSVYVPAVLARGLVPSTLSAYYSQQLKWSRGVFELLVTSYPKLFKSFTWQQKLHYGIVPMHYLSGVIFLINFLIPIFSLIFNTSPINIVFFNFITISFPLVMSIILIRHFVQRWVMEEEERGFHVVGGLLMIGTWWIFIIGLFYTILRKKVPYNPTPKDGRDEDNWSLNIPNLIVIAISVFSIIFGLYRDWNPYNLIMSAFAGINCMILSFTIAASRQSQFRKLKQRVKPLNWAMEHVSDFKASFWKLRRKIYSGVRSAALMITTLIVCTVVYFVNTRSNTEVKQVPYNYHKDILIPGIFAPETGNGLSSMGLVKQYENQSKLQFGIVSLYIPWGDQAECHLPTALLDSIYKINAVPMISWEPWQSLFDKVKNIEDSKKEEKIFARIIKGDYDDYLKRFSEQIKALNRPVFIRFAHEADNPQYPWSAKGGNTAEEFKEGWKYVHDYFAKNNTYNAIWVWNPWKPDAVSTYFPGSQYVDWIGVTNLNYGTRNGSNSWYTMEQLYQPFHENPVFKTDLPVMLAEMGSLSAEGKQDQWFQTAFKSIKNKFPEIKAVVFFNSSLDKNTIDTAIGKPLNWKVENFSKVGLAIKKYNKKLKWIDHKIIAKAPVGALEDSPNSKKHTSLFDIRGVNYAKGQNWSTNFHALKKKEIAADILEIKKVGFNTIKYFGPSVYDRNVLSVAGENGLNIAYSYWFPDNVDFISHKNELDEYADKVISTVSKFKDRKDIILWNIANTPLRKLDHDYYMPDLFFPREAYISWLQKLVSSIKKIDPNRPVTVDLYVNDKLSNNIAMLYKRIPAIDYFGLVVDSYSDSAAVAELSSLKEPWFFSKISTTDFIKNKNNKANLFVTNWQDEITDGFVTFDGLKDYSGKSKFEFYQLSNKWTGSKLPSKIPPIKVLLPAVTIYPNAYVTYRAMVFDSNEWGLAKPDGDLKFKWNLVRTDAYGNPIDLKEVGEGSSITLNIPEYPSSYRLYLYAMSNNEVKIVSTKLNIPLK
ncbi:glycosyltransferase family 2 protein [Pedobacter foliorum]|uniref:glycosyltransferase family 2 protein n=1 Tax=Pedobacter foliorum TaxID=2739058 RepID=UPI001564EF4F|nr:glycosyltransferase family 2 protein [Pedobacter foliorum]NRF40463.1 glycosyltransferase [Pedobacter foliorum]